jgi:hypothetical protein
LLDLIKSTGGSDTAGFIPVARGNTVLDAKKKVFEKKGFCLSEVDAKKKVLLERSRERR